MLQYAINKAKAALGFVGHQWDQHIVAELDSALNKWFDDVPDHRTFFITAASCPNLIWMCFQCGGTPVEKIILSRPNRPVFKLAITNFKF